MDTTSKDGLLDRFPETLCLPLTDVQFKAVMAKAKTNPLYLHRKAVLLATVHPGDDFFSLITAEVESVELQGRSCKIILHVLVYNQHFIPGPAILVDLTEKHGFAANVLSDGPAASDSCSFDYLIFAFPDLILPIINPC